MGQEIERKFLVLSERWRVGSTSTVIKQGYFSRDPLHTARVRVAGDQAFLTIKGRRKGMVRPEFEYPIPLVDAEELLRMCANASIEKTRHVVWFEGMRWEVDEFHGQNAPLVLAEIELKEENQGFARPPWLGQEVTTDKRYYNSRLFSFPYATWGPGLNEGADQVRP